MDKNDIGYCGSDCGHCGMRLPPLDLGKSGRKTVECCLGCRRGDALKSWCRSGCEIRRCCIRRGISSCRECPIKKWCEMIAGKFTAEPDELSRQRIFGTRWALLKAKLHQFEK